MVVLARHVQSDTERMILVRQGQNDRDNDIKGPDTDTDGVPPAVKRNMGNLIFNILSLRQRENIPGEMDEDLLELSSWR